MDPALKNHYHMIAGEIVFREKDSDVINAVRTNGILIDPEREIPGRLLGKAQQILQLNFHQRMESDSIEVLDVVLINFMHLGHMTQAEFQKPPEGMKVQQKSPLTPVSSVDLDKVVAQTQAQND